MTLYLWQCLALKIDPSVMNSLCLLCPKFQLVTWQTTKKISSDFSLNSVSKWCWFVKTMHKCQNGGGFKLSKWCRCVKTLQVYFVKMVQVQNNYGRSRTRPHHHHSYFKCNRTNECSGQSKQSEFTRLASILRYVTWLDIVMIT